MGYPITDQYLVTFNDDGLQKVFTTNWFDPENNFNPDPDIQMIVVDLHNQKYLNASLQWLDIQQDHL